MNCVGIDVSKGKSTVAVLRETGEVVELPFDVNHTDAEVTALIKQLLALEGETKVVLEATGVYHLPIATRLSQAGLFVSIVNPVLIKRYANNTIRNVKTDPKDALKIANYTLSYWNTLIPFKAEESTRAILRITARKYRENEKIVTMKRNGLISLLDSTFPGINKVFSSPATDDGHLKWVDFVATFWHSREVTKGSEKAFTERYQHWCKRHEYNFSKKKAAEIYAFAKEHFGVLPYDDDMKWLVISDAEVLLASIARSKALLSHMNDLAKKLPEYDAVMSMRGVGPALGPQLIAEIGDVRRFHSKAALVAFAGIDAPPFQSGQMNLKNRKISKRGSATLRRTLYIVMKSLLLTKNSEDTLNDPVYGYFCTKKKEGKAHKQAMIAAENKFLRRYYGIISRIMNEAQTA